jgi:cytochrome c-type biogenesis protein CcmI
MTMPLFWIAAVLLLAIAALFVFFPLLSAGRSGDQELRDELNKAFYKQRLAEITREAGEGIVNDEQELVVDLKQSLLDDVPKTMLQRDSHLLSTKRVLTISMVMLVVLSVGVYHVFGHLDQVKRWESVSAQLPELSKKLMAPNGNALTEPEMDDLTLALRTRLYYQPNDATGWLLLGRIALANRDAQMAVGAMEKAYQLSPNDKSVAFGYAQALMVSDDELQQKRAIDMLNSMVNSGSTDLRVYSLLAFYAYEQQQYELAIKHWTTMKTILGPQDSRYELLERSIDGAEKALDKASTLNDATLGLTITVSIGDKVTVPENAVMIVSVHDEHGSPMPIAAQRYKLTQFPRTVFLDDSNSMIQGRKISDLVKMVVKVRIDSDGNVMTKNGDWFGQSQPVQLGQTVAVEINQHY